MDLGSNDIRIRWFPDALECLSIAGAKSFNGQFCDEGFLELV